jgi:DNA-binding transcriptional MerR regulator
MAGARTEYGTIATAKTVGISLRQLYYWIRVLRVVRPRRRTHGRRRFQHFAARDLARLKAVKRLVDRGYTLRAAAKAAAHR